MAITPISTRKTSTAPRKDGRARGSSQKDDHTLIRITDKSGAYIAMLDNFNPYVEAISSLLEKAGLVLEDNISYQASKPNTEAASQKLVLK